MASERERFIYCTFSHQDDILKKENVNYYPNESSGKCKRKQKHSGNLDDDRRHNHSNEQTF